MNIDIRTLAIFLSLVNTLQVFALFVQYKMTRFYQGLGWWTLGTACWALGSAANYLRDDPVFGWAAIMTNNMLFVGGLVLIHFGYLRFFSKTEKRTWLVGLWITFTLIASILTFFHKDLSDRQLNISIAVAGVSFIIANGLYRYKIQSVRIYANFLALLFLFNGAFFTLRALTAYTIHPTNELIAVSISQISAYIVALITSTLWTFGSIIMVNQRLNTENSAAREHFEMLFNGSPDPVLLTRFSDGKHVNINKRFTTMSGYSLEEMQNNSAPNERLWCNLEDRVKLGAMLKEKGYCEGLEAEFYRKDASKMVGMITANVVIMEGQKHIISIVRDVTERKRHEDQIQKMIHQLEIERDYAQNNALIDNLTLLMNRGFFDEALSSEFYRLKRSGEPLSLIMMDIDHFKKYNDHYGHLAGDDCLRKVAAAIRSVVGRKPDVVARYGGEEFVVILPETGLQGANNMAELIRRSVVDLAIPHAASERYGIVTISLGLVSIQTVGLPSPEKVIQLADDALYLAKKQGRNRVEVAEIDPALASSQQEFVRLVWRVSAESGNGTIDEAHKGLFKDSNELLSAILSGQSHEVCWVLIEKLLGDVVAHFNQEEAIFKSSEFPLSEAHSERHKELVSKAVGLADRYKQGDSVLGELFSFLAYDVIARHMYMEDKKFFPYLH
jgi:diguanylate cyclase (GGDEF)-like protein/hemerythrin-like metal-binding protein/PAS domain S-box-containing protein